MRGKNRQAPQHSHTALFGSSSRAPWKAFIAFTVSFRARRRGPYEYGPSLRERERERGAQNSITLFCDCVKVH